MCRTNNERSFGRVQNCNRQSIAVQKLHVHARSIRSCLIVDQQGLAGITTSASHSFACKVRSHVRSGSVCRSSTAGPIKMVVSQMRRWSRRLNDPGDNKAGLACAAALLSLEAVLCAAIIARVPYTEIDWQAYMQQVRQFDEGERDYLLIKGGTGPLVYPAGFLHLFSALRWLTGGGDIAAAQVCFAAFYLATQAVVMLLYVRSRVMPPWTLCLLCLSKRVHSIFLLRLFNDGPAMCLAYVGLALLVARRYRAAVLLFSAGVSIKMNVLLMAPAVLNVMLKETTALEVGKAALVGILLQGVLAAPFLASAPGAYLSRAFELSRVFQHVWSVNLKFLPEPLFQSKPLAAALLAAHIALLSAFAQWRWNAADGGIGGLLRRFWARSAGKEEKRSRPGASSTKETNSRSDANVQAVDRLPPAEVIGMVLTGNFIGIVCARTLHFQFYSWYFHSIPFLLWSSDLSTRSRLALWACIEVIWNLYPSSSWSSAALLTCHAVMLAALFQTAQGCYRRTSENIAIDDDF